ncbi:MAG: hypothetical protein ACE5Q3_03895 [Alphaproteobacteria bacterium]
MNFILTTHGNWLTMRDVRVIERIAEVMIRAGLWTRIERWQDCGFDYFNVHLPGATQPLFSIGRSLSGRYVLMDFRDSSIRYGENLAEVLDDFASLATPLPMAAE